VPIDVDVDLRLREIAEATLAVVGQGGAQGVTIRSVAASLGGSTARVTNYLPSREALLMNAIDHALRAWRADLDATLGGVTRRDRLRELARWSATTKPGDAMLRQLFFELLGRAGSESAIRAALADDGDEHREDLREAAEDAGAPDAEFMADVLHLTLRGFYLASVENPRAWTTERVTPIIERLIETLMSRREA
jgi:AcrR family transcriptional regulator